MDHFSHPVVLVLMLSCELFMLLKTGYFHRNLIDIMSPNLFRGSFKYSTWSYLDRLNSFSDLHFSHFLFQILWGGSKCSKYDWYQSYTFLGSGIISFFLTFFFNQKYEAPSENQNHKQLLYNFTGLHKSRKMRHLVRIEIISLVQG